MYTNNKINRAFFIITFIFSSILFAQEKEMPYFYIQVEFWEDSSTPRIDYGQILRIEREGFMTPLNEKGEAKFFYTKMDAINFMVSNGWEVFSVYPIKENGSYSSGLFSNSYGSYGIIYSNAYLLRKRATEADKKWLYNLTHKNKLP